MNSVQAYKGFITFALFLGFSSALLLGYRYIVTKPTQTQSNAGQEAIVPTNVFTTSVSKNSATITWETKQADTNTLYYSDNNDACMTDVQNCKKYEETTLNKYHLAELNNLKPNTVYYYRIQTSTGVYPNKDVYSFKTESESNKENSDESNDTEENTNENNTDKAETDKSNNQQEENQSEEETNTNDNPKSESNTSEDDFDGIKPLDNNSNKDEKNKEAGDTNESDYDGIQPNTNDTVLGTSTINTNDLIKEEFQKAIKYNDSNYDFNNDGVVNDLDYPLFIYFITQSN